MMAWTDERMDDMATQMRHGFAVVDKDIRELRAEIRGARSKLEGDAADTRSELKKEIADTKTELKKEIADTRSELKSEIAVLRTGMNRWAVVIVVTMLGLFGANLVPGVGG